MFYRAEELSETRRQGGHAKAGYTLRSEDISEADWRHADAGKSRRSWKRGVINIRNEDDGVAAISGIFRGDDQF